MAFVNTHGILPDTVNLQVPTENIRQHQQEITERPPELLTFINELCEWARTENLPAEHLRHRKWYRNERFYQGDHLVRFNAKTGRVEVGQPRHDDPFYPNNQFRGHVRSIHKEVVNSNCEVLIRAKSDDPKKQGGARKGKAYWQDVQRRKWTDDLKQEESMNLLLKGNSFRCLLWNPMDGEDVEEPTYEDQPYSMPPESFCIDCGMSGPPEEMGMECPQCQSANIVPVEEQQMQMPVQTGMRKKKSGDLDWRVVPPERVKLHLHCRRFEDSAYLLLTELILKEVIDYCYPNVKYAVGTAASDTALRMEQENERSPGYVGSSGFGYYMGSTSDATPRFVKLERFWFQPFMYASIKHVVPQDTEIGVEGDIIPANTPLIELFPDGLFVARIGAAIVDIRNEHFLDHFVHIGWDKVPGRVWCDSYADDLIEPQRQINELDSLTFENFMWNAVPPKVINQLKIERGKARTRPGYWMIMKNPSLMDEPSKYIWQPEQHAIVGAEMYREEKRRQMQFLAGSFSLESGVPGGSNTATGMQIVRNAVSALIGVPLQLRGVAEIKTARIGLKLAQRNGTGSRYLTLLSPYGEPEGQYFQMSDIDGDYEFTIRQNSWLPRNDAERKQDVMEAGVACGIQGGVWSKMFPAEAKPIFIDVFGLPQTADPFMSDRRKCLLNIDKIIKGVSVAMEAGIDPVAFTIGAQGMDPMTGMPQTLGPLPGVPPQVTVDPEDDPMIFVQTIKEYLKTDMGMNLPPEIKDLLRMYMKGHEMVLEMQMMQAMMQQAAMGPPQGKLGPNEQGGSPNKPPGKEGGGMPPKNEGMGKPQPSKGDI